VGDAQLLVSEMGYEVWEAPGRLRIVDRGLSVLWFWRLFLGIWCAALLLLAPGLGIAFKRLGEPGADFLIVAGLIGGSAVGVVTLLIHRAFQRRRDAPLEEVPVTAEIDREQRTLIADGAVLSPCGEVRATIDYAIGDRSRGVMRWVVLHPPRRRKLKVFKTNSLQTAEQVVALLENCGLAQAEG